jgi:hypothetical protein
LYFEEFYNLCPSPNIADDEIKKHSSACDTRAGVEGRGEFLQGFFGELEHLR